MNNCICGMRHNVVVHTACMSLLATCSRFGLNQRPLLLSLRDGWKREQQRQVCFSANRSASSVSTAASRSSGSNIGGGIGLESTHHLEEEGAAADVKSSPSSSNKGRSYSLILNNRHHHRHHHHHKSAKSNSRVSGPLQGN